MLPFSFLLCFFFKDACSLKEIWEWKIPAIISPTVYPCSREFDMNKLGVCLWNGVVSGYRTVVVWSLPFRQSWFSRSISPSEATFWLELQRLLPLNLAWAVALSRAWKTPSSKWNCPRMVMMKTPSSSAQWLPGHGGSCPSRALVCADTLSSRNEDFLFSVLKVKR